MGNDGLLGALLFIAFGIWIGVCLCKARGTVQPWRADREYPKVVPINRGRHTPLLQVPPDSATQSFLAGSYTPTAHEPAKEIDA